MEWTDYIIKMAPLSKDNAKLWFRYLRKYIDKCGYLFTPQDIDSLCNNHALTPFQRVSLKAAFEEGSQTRQHIISLNNKVDVSNTISMWEKFKNESNE